MNNQQSKDKLCPICGTINDSHHSAHCIDHYTDEERNPIQQSTSTDKTCPDCEGRGYYYPSSNIGGSCKIDCKSCNGTGIKPHKEIESTSEEISGLKKLSLIISHLFIDKKISSDAYNSLLVGLQKSDKDLQKSQAEIELLNKEKVHYFEELQKAQAGIKALECKYACDRRDSTGRCNMDCSRNSAGEKDLFEEKK